MILYSRELIQNSGTAELSNFKEFTELMGDTKYVIYGKWNKNLIVSLPVFYKRRKHYDSVVRFIWKWNNSNKYHLSIQIHVY